MVGIDQCYREVTTGARGKYINVLRVLPGKFLSTISKQDICFNTLRWLKGYEMQCQLIKAK